MRSNNGYIVSIVLLMACVVGTAYYVHVTFSNIEEFIPLKIIEHEKADDTILHMLTEITHDLEAASIVSVKEREQYIVKVRHEMKTVKEKLEIKREQQGHDNFIGAAAIYGILQPAFYDISIWLDQGVGGLLPTSDEVLMITTARAKSALHEANELHEASYDIAIDLLSRQAIVINSFRSDIILVLIVLAGMAGLSIYYIFNRRTAMQALQQSELKHRRIYENATEGIFQVRVDGNLIDTNPALASMLGYESPEQLLQEVNSYVIDIYRDPKVAEKHFMLVNKGQYLIDELHQWRKRDGTLTWGAINAHAVRNQQGKILYVEGTLTDMNARVEAELNLRKAKEMAELANRTKSEFLANMSHELRTPLNAVIGFSEILKSEAFGPLGHENYKEYSDDIYDAGKHLLDVINEVLDVAKIEAGQLQLSERTINLNAAMESCIRMLSVRAFDAGVNLILDLPAGLPGFMGDETRIKQIIVNLASNAVKFTNSGGTVTISANLRSDGGLTLKISDTGIGIAKQDIPRVLDRFGQVQTTYARNNEGTGLGLTLVQMLIDIHGGTFELESEVGVGTTCIIHFPSDRSIKLAKAG